MSVQLSPSFIIRTLINIPKEIVHEGISMSDYTIEQYTDCINLVTTGVINKDSVKDVMLVQAKYPEMTIKEVIKFAGLANPNEINMEKVIQTVITDKSDLVRSKGDRAIGPLMGLVMKELRGKADGGVVSAILKKEIDKILQENS